MKTYIGIDVGKNGFIAVIDPLGHWGFSEIPTIGKMIDAKALNNLFSGLHPEYIFAVIEDVHAIFGAAAKSTFEFGYAAGLIEMALVANGIPFAKVAPKKWQKTMWEGVPLQQKASSTGKTMVNDTKRMSEIAAKRLFPNLDLRKNERCRTPDDNKVDAILIAEYARRNF